MKSTFSGRYPYNEKITFDISYLENIKETTLYSIDFSEVDSGNRIKVLDNIYEFNVQKEKGEYYYPVSIKWDNMHNFEYLFKIMQYRNKKYLPVYTT
ncbi:hypothetical protein NSA50_17000 [Clostridium sp. DSM 100503]|uniref:hypothetical protein n=1 Tax=Clostridium sp. DSM 100503 TaxID=2963282 RepID=UPI002149EA61|nr:hypothetical protein [Clostridium sp. DSM 100503]MCR1952724.1 hypothetical protein [Clostridium sp. DSM 100503]